MSEYHVVRFEYSWMRVDVHGQIPDPPDNRVSEMIREKRTSALTSLPSISSLSGSSGQSEMWAVQTPVEGSFFSGSQGRRHW